VTGSNYSATATFSASNTAFFYLASPVTVPASGLYFIGFSSVGGGTLIRGSNTTALYVNPVQNGNPTTGFTSGLRFGSITGATLLSNYASSTITPQGGMWWVGLS
jgi:hypothetical protein